MDEKWRENTNLVAEVINSNYVTRKLRQEEQTAFAVWRKPDRKHRVRVMSTANGKSEMKVENFPNLGNKQIKLFKKILIGEHDQKQIISM